MHTDRHIRSVSSPQSHIYEAVRVEQVLFTLLIHLNALNTVFAVILAEQGLHVCKYRLSFHSFVEIYNGIADGERRETFKAMNLSLIRHVIDLISNGVSH